MLVFDDEEPFRLMQQWLRRYPHFHYELDLGGGIERYGDRVCGALRFASELNGDFELNSDRICGDLKRSDDFVHCNLQCHSVSLDPMVTYS